MPPKLGPPARIGAAAASLPPQEATKPTGKRKADDDSVEARTEKVARKAQPPIGAAAAAASQPSHEAKKPTGKKAQSGEDALFESLNGFKGSLEEVLKIFDATRYTILDLRDEAGPADHRLEKPDFAIDLGADYELTFATDSLDPATKDHLVRSDVNLAHLKATTIKTRRVLLQVLVHPERKKEYLVKVLNNSFSGTANISEVSAFAGFVAGLAGYREVQVHVKEIILPDTTSATLVLTTPIGDKHVHFAFDKKKEKSAVTSLFDSFRSILKWKRAAAKTV